MLYFVIGGSPLTMSSPAPCSHVTLIDRLRHSPLSGSRFQNRKSDSRHSTRPCGTEAARPSAKWPLRPDFPNTASAACLFLCLALMSCGGGSHPTPPSTPQADFSLTVSPASLTIAPGATGSSVSVLATPVNSFSGTVSVAIGGLPG